MDPLQDQRQRLKEKLSQLEEQIVERARRFINCNRYHKNKVQLVSLPPNAILSELGSEEGGVEKATKPYEIRMIEEWQEKCRQTIKNLEMNLINSEETYKQLAQLAHIKSSWNKHIQFLHEAFLQLSEILKNVLIDPTPQKDSSKTAANQFVQLLKRCWTQINEVHWSRNKQIWEELQLKMKEMNKSAEAGEMKVIELKTRCELIARALNESEQANYELRLQVQDGEIKIRSLTQEAEASRQRAGSYADKIEVLEVMKREYLRAYSRIKDQKELLAFQVLDLKTQLGDLQIQNIDEGQVQLRLKTIIEHSEEETLEDTAGKPGSENCSGTTCQTKLKLTEGFVDKLPGRVYQILCNLPAQSNQDLLFFPSNEAELEGALECIYQFAIKFDSYRQKINKQFEKEMRSLLKVFQQIAMSQRISSDMLIASASQNLEENSLSKSLLNGLIKKIGSSTGAKSKQTWAMPNQPNRSSLT